MDTSEPTFSKNLRKAHERIAKLSVDELRSVAGHIGSRLARESRLPEQAERDTYCCCEELSIQRRLHDCDCPYYSRDGRDTYDWSTCIPTMYLRPQGGHSFDRYHPETDPKAGSWKRWVEQQGFPVGIEVLMTTPTRAYIYRVTRSHVTVERV